MNLIICPIYSKHFKYIKKIYKTYQKINNISKIDFKFILSPDENLELFKKYKISKNNYWIINQEMEGGAFNQYIKMFNKKSNIINLKKFIALNYFKNVYENILVIDAESFFLKKNINEIINNYNIEPFLLSNKIINKDYQNKIIDDCLSFFNINDFTQKDIFFLKENYFWFNIPCIYNTKILNNLFKYLIKNNGLNWMKKLTFYSFDYYIYMIFLYKYRNIKIIDLNIKTAYGALETKYLYEVIPISKMLDLYKTYIFCCSYLIYKNIKSEIDNFPNLFLVNQMDFIKSNIKSKMIDKIYKIKSIFFKS